MSTSINTSGASISIIRELSDNQSRISSSMRRLSSGLRINNGAEDSAGMAVSQNLLRQASSNQIALKNISDGTSLIDTTDSALHEVSEVLIRLRQLTIQSSNGSLSTIDRNALNIEFKALSNSTTGAINGIFESALFNESRLISSSPATAPPATSPPPSPATIDLQIGWQQTDQYSIQTKDFSFYSAILDASDINTSAAATLAMNDIDFFIDSVTSYRAQLGSSKNNLSSIKGNLESNIEKTSIARGRIIDANYAREATALSREQMKQKIGITMLRQVQESFGLVLQLIK
jgi:flagellin